MAGEGCFPTHGNNFKAVNRLYRAPCQCQRPAARLAGPLLHLIFSAEGDVEADLRLADPIEEMVVGGIALDAEVIPEVDPRAQLSSPSRVSCAGEVVGPR